ncbi:MAG: hypothetical protein JWO67_29 [Streptosporangiaceae bacterium]|nr:hypothetical protein [Streptosporangiaceae bacterium]
MKSVTHGERVEFDYSVTDLGHPAGAGVGLVLDRAFDTGTWYVMREGERSAVKVKATDMQPARRTAR